jgi:Fe-S-cluster containining protein
MIEHSVAKCLSFHAAYRCRQSGACCSAGWAIPFDTVELRIVGALALAGGTIQRTLTGGSAVLEHGRCSFLEHDTGGRPACEIHRVGGHAALPLTCRMFPRIVLHDTRGTFISLSHFCPTAMAMLFEDGPPASIVEAPAALEGSDPLDGLNARDVWPPLLRPGLMMDLDSYDTWERLAVELLTREGVPLRAALDGLDAATSSIARWQPDGGVPLEHVVRDAFARIAPRTAALAAFEPAVKRWLAARLFGTWIAYQGNGLMTIVRYLRACCDVFDVELARDGRAREAIRRADHLIVHESSSQQLANLLNERS